MRVGPVSGSLNGRVRPVGDVLRERSALESPPTRLCLEPFIHTVLYVRAHAGESHCHVQCKARRERTHVETDSQSEDRAGHDLKLDVTSVFTRWCRDDPPLDQFCREGGTLKTSWKIIEKIQSVTFEMGRNSTATAEEVVCSDTADLRSH